MQPVRHVVYANYHGGKPFGCSLPEISQACQSQHVWAAIPPVPSPEQCSSLGASDGPSWRLLMCWLLWLEHWPSAACLTYDLL